MKLGILETGAPPATLAPRFGSYPRMFRHLLGEGFDYTTYDVRKGEWPERPQVEDAYLITGSAAGVYESDPWIGELRDFLNAAKGQAKLVGVCFGHQAMADAFGGKVIKSPKGWGVGLHRYEVTTPQPWTGAASDFAIPASYQDQVVELPAEARVVAASAFTPFAMLAYADQPAISVQGHPEFAPDYAAALIESRREERLTDAQAETALASLKQPDDRSEVGGWISAFLRS